MENQNLNKGTLYFIIFSFFLYIDDIESNSNFENLMKRIKQSISKKGK